jgi:hypothetical protein
MIKSSTKLQVPCDECGKFTLDLWEAYFQGAIPSYLCESCKEDLRIFAAFVRKVENEGR